MRLVTIFMLAMLFGCVPKAPLQVAIEKNDVKNISFLIESGQAVNEVYASSDTPLIHAASKGHTEITKLLIENDANVNYANKNSATPLTSASWNGHSEIVKFLIESGANVNHTQKNSYTPLTLASEKGYTEIAKLLIENGANVNYALKNSATPLTLVSSKGYVEIAKLLIENGANVNYAQKNFDTPLTVASSKGYTGIAKLLIKNGANVNYANKNSYTPLIIASMEGHTEIAKLLIENGANLNIQTKSGDTALHWAANRGQWAIINLLLSQDANKSILSRSGLDAASVAKTPSFADGIRNYKLSHNQARPNKPLRVTTFSGTGWVTTGGYVVTNYHVIKNAANVYLVLGDKKKVSAQVIVKDRKNDIAILSPETKLELPGLPIALESPRIGSKVFTLGFPRPGVMGINQKFTNGSISALTGIMDDPTLIQISAPIQPGNSGGPLIDMKGAVIGVTSATLRSKVSGGSVVVAQNVNYAVKVIYVKVLLDTIKNKNAHQILKTGESSLEGLVERIDQSVILVVAETKD